MALDLLNGKVRVYNYELSPVGFPSQHNINGNFIRGRDEEEEFVMDRIALDDIEAENTKSDLFKVGRLRFHPDEENEVYGRLGIEDKDNIMSDAQLIEKMKDDSLENIKFISNLKSATLLQRMKAILFSMERNGTIPPHNVSSVVTERCNELKYGGKRNKDSEINRLLESDRKQQEDSKLKDMLAELSKKVDKLEKENSEKDNTINQSQTAIQDLLKMVNDLKNSNQEVKTTPKTAGRPPKKTS